MSKKVVVEIVEQPKSVERFRYESEGRTNRSKIPMTPRTYASIRVLNYTGPVTVVVSCVTTEKPYRQHPNVLVGEDCKRGVCTVSFKTDESDPTVYSFNNMAIQCIKKGDIEQVLTERQKCNVDPFKTGFAHKKDKTFRTGVRLCFQVFIRSGDKLKPIYPVYPIVSDIIRGKDSLEISDISDTTSPTTGGKKIIVFCSKVSQGDIKVRFYRQNENTMVEWEAWVQKPILVHRQAAIVFETPAYATHDIIEPVDVLFELVRPSDGRRSEPVRYFRYVPDPMNVFNLIRKKEQKITQSEVLFKYIQQKGDEKQSFAKTEQLNFNPNIPPMVPNIPPMNHNIPTMNANQQSNTCTTARPPTTQSNLVSNFDRHDQAPINGQSVPHQPTHCDNRSFSHNHTQRNSARSDRCQYGGERPQMQPLHPQVNQPHHSRHQHSPLQLQPSNIEPMITDQLRSRNSNAVNPSHCQLQQQNIFSEYQPLSNHQMHPSHGQSQPQHIHSKFQGSTNHQVQSHNTSQSFHLATNSRQPQFNSYLQQQEHRHHHQQEHHFQQLDQQQHSQSNFHGMSANPGFGGTYLSSATPYRPIPSFYTEHEQNVFANNFVPDGNIDNASNTLHPLLIH
ncbi:transcription factor p65-like isoform X2 [Bradysia coprophila]|uniref:transcription factor p65-like isoform X2 n=1 Tax=Bradysia coprophila TaxID=38358 RepID=UPI00187DC48C|nr:transcription factor p65-like isoform X2 [Bradysia coprophila]